MERFQQVLYVEKGPRCSARGLARALDLAWAHRARLTVGCLVGGSSLAPGAAQRRECAVERTRERLAALVSRGGARGVATDFRTFDDGLVRDIADIVADGRYDLVMTLVGSRAPLRPWTTNRLERALLHACPVPVWLVDPAQHNPVRVVLAAVDVSDDRCPDLNRRIVEAAASVAERAGAELHFLNAWALPGEPILSSPLTGVGRRRVVRMRAEECQRRRRRLDGLLAATVPDFRAHLRVKRGGPTRVVREEAWRYEADLVVVGNSARHGIQGLLFGNVAERLVGRVPSSVLVLPEKATLRSPVPDPRPEPAWRDRSPGERLAEARS